MIINGVLIDHTFAEAFPMKATRVIITAQTEQWAFNAAKSMTGFATSVIGCGCEADIERYLKPSETPDGRPGVSAMLFTMGAKSLVKQLETRAGQSVLTSPTSALFSGIDGGIRIPLGKNLRYFGDGFQGTAGYVVWPIFIFLVLQGQYMTDIPQMMAISAIAVIPMLIAYLLVQSKLRSTGLDSAIK
jgi:formylmethanofuran--tetrahydromethanopterin N-formyltransferase